MRRGKKPVWVRDLAKKRIKILLSLAKENIKKHPKRSKRYVELAKKISKRYNVPISSISKDWKKNVCKKCNTFWIQGLNVKVRTDSKTKTLQYICQECGYVKKYGYKKTKKA